MAHQNPFISVLIAARNEEKNIACCLTSLQNLDYPSAKVEILIGDDASTDQTAMLVKSFMLKMDNLKYYCISTNKNAKMGVLAYLEKQAQGDFIFVTDADMKLPATWIQGMLLYADEKVGIISGNTYIEGNSWWDQMQHMEWVQAQSNLHVAGKIGRYLTVPVKQ